jgi:hypothetical protein
MSAFTKFPLYQAAHRRRLSSCPKGDTPMQYVTYLLARFSEPSSYAGLGAVIALVGWHLSDTELGALVQLFAAGCALAALLLKERGTAAGG